MIGYDHGDSKNSITQQNHKTMTLTHHYQLCAKHMSGDKGNY